MSAALKLAAGFGLAAVLILVVELLLALFPSPVWLVVVLVPLVAAAVVFFVRNRQQRPAPVPVDPEPRMSPEELAISDAATLFNQSTFPRTIAGLRKTLGEPNTSIVGAETDAAVFVTVAWELSWYQYRCVPETQRVGLSGHGQELAELPERYQQWNARVGDDGRVAPG